MRCAKKGSSKKGCASKTHKGRKDYTTKKTSKYFDRKGHRSDHAEGKKTKRRPYSKKGRKSRKSGKSGGKAHQKGRKSRKNQWARPEPATPVLPTLANSVPAYWGNYYPGTQASARGDE